MFIEQTFGGTPIVCAPSPELLRELPLMRFAALTERGWHQLTSNDTRQVPVGMLEHLYVFEVKHPPHHILQRLGEHL